MSRAKTKIELIESANVQFEKMLQLIDSISKKDQLAIFNYDDLVKNKKEAHWKRDKNIRDLLIHLYEWHQLFINWVKSNQSGVTSSFLPKPYNWKTYGDMNVSFWEKHQNTNYVDSINMVKGSHNDVVKTIDGFSNEDLFSKGVYSWTGGSTLGQYCVSVTSSHYDWAISKIKLYIKTLNKS